VRGLPSVTLPFAAGALVIVASSPKPVVKSATERRCELYRSDESISFFSWGIHPPALFLVFAMMSLPTDGTWKSLHQVTLNCAPPDIAFWPVVWASRKS
jgi:hypothetical protein